MAKSGRPTEFAEVLGEALDGSGYSRAEWASILDVSTSAISQWLSGDTVPRPDHLRAIVDVLVEDTDVDERIVARFDELLARPATDVSPHGTRMGPTIGHYLVKPLRDGFSRTLETVPPLMQEVVLREAAASCRILRDVPRDQQPTLLTRRRSFQRGRPNEYLASAKAALDRPVRREAALPTESMESFMRAAPQERCYESVTRSHHGGARRPPVTRRLQFA